MKVKSHIAFRAIVACLLLSGLFILPTKASSQSGVRAYPLLSEDQSQHSDVAAYVLYDRQTERYTLTGVNPSGRKLKICFYAGGSKYVYRVSSSSFSKPFDLKGADDGVYTFAIQDGKALLKTDVRIKTTLITRREASFASNLILR